MSTPANAPYLKDEASYLAHVRTLWHEQRRDGATACRASRAIRWANGP